MNETTWLTSAAGDAMLKAVSDRLTPRQWLLLSAACARRLWDFLPDGVLQQSIDFAERAGPLTPEQRSEWLKKIDEGLPETIAAAERAQLAIVRSADPGAAGQERPVLTRSNQVAPSFPLFQAASRQAAFSIRCFVEAVTQAAVAIRVLFEGPNEGMLKSIRPLIEQSLSSRTHASSAANKALRLKHEGDEHADRSAAARNKRVAESAALAIVQRIEGGDSRRRFTPGDWDDPKPNKHEQKQLARLLRDIVGNPFRPTRFEPAWRTKDVVALAQVIFEDRSFNRLPILADALLDAGCDEDSILRHCRGTELGVQEPPHHVRGCWVIRLLLGGS
jgi:hypothetical protein